MLSLEIKYMVLSDKTVYIFNKNGILADQLSMLNINIQKVIIDSENKIFFLSDTNELYRCNMGRATVTKLVKLADSELKTCCMVYDKTVILTNNGLYDITTIYVSIVNLILFPK